MADTLDDVTFAALQAFDGALEGAGCQPHEKMKLAMMYIHKLVSNEGYGISRKDFMGYAGAVVTKFDEREMRSADFDRRNAELAAKNFHGHPKQRGLN